MRIVIHVELSQHQAAALFRLCDPHIRAAIRDGQSADMVGGASEVQKALKDAGVTSAWPWIDTGEATV